MSCITKAWDRNCATSRTGGVLDAYITEQENVDVTYDSSTGEVTAITLTTPGEVYPLVFEQETARFVSNKADGEHRVNRQLNEGVVFNPDQSVINFIQAAKDCHCPLVVVHREAAGRIWIWGHEEGNTRGVMLGETNKDSGAEFNDTNQIVINFNAPWIKYETEVTETAYEAFITAITA